MTETFYDLLGVAPDATTEEIESAYREAIKEVHPDVSDDVDASERTTQLNKAKDVLTDDDERARYDRLGHEAYTSGGPATDDSSSGSPGATGGSSTGGPGATGGPSTGADTGSSSTGRHSSSDTSAGAGANRAGSRRGRADRSDTGSGGHSRSRSRSGQRSGPNGTDDFGRRATKGPWETSENAGPSARRQAAAGSGGGPDPHNSWNAWDTSRVWAVHQDTEGSHGLQVNRLFPPDQSLVLLASTFICYPFFIFSSLLPAFPFIARITVALCTVLMIAYLISIPEAAILVFGSWSLLTPLAIFLIPGLSIFSLVGVIGLMATWVPLGLAVLTFIVVRPL